MDTKKWQSPTRARHGGRSGSGVTVAILGGSRGRCAPGHGGLPGLNHRFQTALTGSPAACAQIEETMSPEALEIVARWILERVGEGRNGDRVP